MPLSLIHLIFDDISSAAHYPNTDHNCFSSTHIVHTSNCFSKFLELNLLGLLRVSYPIQESNDRENDENLTPCKEYSGGAQCVCF